MDDTQPQPIPEPQAAVPPAPPAAMPPAPPAAGSRLLTIGILMATVAVGAVFIKQDRDKGKEQTSTSAVAGKPGDEKSNIKIGGAAPKLVLKDLNGKTVDLAALKGKVVLVDFWATWCDPCTVLIPWFIDFRNRYGSQGLEVVGVAMDEEGIEAVKPYAEKAKMNYIILLGNEDTAQAWGGIFGLPTSFIIDRQGNIQHRHVGLVGRDVFEKEIRGLL